MVEEPIAVTFIEALVFTRSSPRFSRMLLFLWFGVLKLFILSMNFCQKVHYSVNTLLLILHVLMISNLSWIFVLWVFLIAIHEKIWIFMWFKLFRLIKNTTESRTGKIQNSFGKSLQKHLFPAFILPSWVHILKLQLLHVLTILPLFPSIKTSFHMLESGF